MNCKCGHMMSIHDEGGCQHADRTKGGIDLVCRCGLSPDAIAESKLAALREAGEKMEEILKFLQLQNDAAHLESAGLWNVNGETEIKVAEAREAWEAAKK